MACTWTVICGAELAPLLPSDRGKPLSPHPTSWLLLVDARLNDGGSAKAENCAGCCDWPPPNKLEISEISGIALNPPPRNWLAVLSTSETCLPALEPCV